MLEGVVARLLNQLLGKYVADLDSENFNVGIFSGQVQLTDLKLKTEALYELKLPIQVIAGTIGTIRIQIPWNYLWKKPILINIEDVHILSQPIVGSTRPFDEETNRRLVRAFKLATLENLRESREIIGGPNLFSEYLITSIVNNLHFTISNVHVRYEDEVSVGVAVSAGICIGCICAETTNSKWKPNESVTEANSEASYYLVKIEGVSIYFNPQSSHTKWDFPSQYYQWRNAMTGSLSSYSMNQEIFDFVLKPMSAKIKSTVTRKGNDIYSVHNDLNIQDFNVQVSKEQYDSILSVYDSLNRMFVSWNFLSFRPDVNIVSDPKKWWKYAYEATVEQRIKPYTWKRIKTVRKDYRNYLETYKKIILSPNDTELKLDLQKYEDNVSLFCIVIARQQARLLVSSTSFREKNIWSLLPSPERADLCHKIGFDMNSDGSIKIIEHVNNINIGIVSLSLISNEREIFVVTLTQFIVNFVPNFQTKSHRLTVKVEGMVVEGVNSQDTLSIVASSEHFIDSPAYFFKIDFEKQLKGDDDDDSSFRRKLSLSMDSVEVLYEKATYMEIKRFLDNGYFRTRKETKFMENKIQKINKLINNKWEFSADIKIPYVIIPEYGSLQIANHLLIIDFGRFLLKTEPNQHPQRNDFTTSTEIEEKIYTRFHIENTNTQLLFTEKKQSWKDARKEKDTSFHLIAKHGYSAVYAFTTSGDSAAVALPKCKLQVKFPSLKLNVSERKILLLAKMADGLRLEKVEVSRNYGSSLWSDDLVVGSYGKSYLESVQNSVTLITRLTKIKKVPIRRESVAGNKKCSLQQNRTDINKVWARIVDLPGLEDNISPSNTINVLFRISINEFTAIFSKSSDRSDRQYLSLRFGGFSLDWAFLTFGPAIQISLNNFLLTDKLHVTPSGQYIDLIYSPFPSSSDVLTVLHRKVDASCPEFWTYFHGVETSLVVDLGTVHFFIHEDAIRTIVKYFHYLNSKFRVSEELLAACSEISPKIRTIFRSQLKAETPVPPGAVKFSYSTRLSDMNVRICDSDFDIMNIYLSGLEVDVLFRANERFVIRSFLSSLIVEHLSDVSLYTKILYTEEDKVYEIKYVRYNTITSQTHNSPVDMDVTENGSLTFHLGQIHITFLYKLFIQLQRLLVNIEGLPLIENVFGNVYSIFQKATDTLKSTTRIRMSINISNPILIFPQKSSSPNIIIFNAGELTIENFFKRNSDNIVENILIKLNDVMVSRGIMTLTSSLEMQETIVDPLNLHIDAKRYLQLNSPKPLNWDIDAALNAVQITLSQRDIIIITSIFSDEDQLTDFFTETIKSPTTKPKTDGDDDDDSVKALESFFSEPKQKYVTAKLSWDSLELSLFFDSGELLSSPIRDLSHGLCKVEVSEVLVGSIFYTDGSLDGRLAVDTVLVEEIGPEANKFDRGILRAPLEDKTNNNSNVLINRPPIIDITYHQNESSDTSADIIVGQLRLTVSVPLFEKFIVFIMECLPKNTTEAGIVNLGYVAETQEKSPEKNKNHSYTISLRINRPEVIFMIESTSNNKRYFKTTCEILCDYSFHCNRLSSVVSLSSLHTIFYDEVFDYPYVVLKHCDVEVSKNDSVEKGTKITATISSIYLEICNRLVHSIDDILNDISEHFKLPETTKTTKPNQQPIKDNLWEPEKLPEFPIIHKTDPLFENTRTNPTKQIFLMPKLEIIIIFGLEEIQVLLLKTTVEITAYDWSSSLNSTCELTLQANYFNEALQAWEPFVDPVFVDESNHKPWDLLVKVFQDKPMPILQNNLGKVKGETEKARRERGGNSGDESGDDMVFIEPMKSGYCQGNRRVKTSLSTFLDDSDSENEDGAMQKLAAAISDLFTGDWNENEDSASEESSDSEDDSDGSITAPPQVTQNSDKNTSEKSTYIIVDAKEILNVTFTPALLKLFNEILTQYSSKTLSIVQHTTGINIVNDIGPNSKVELYENVEPGNDESAVFVCCKMYENQDSCPNTPSKNALTCDDYFDDKDSLTDEAINIEPQHDSVLLSSLQFPEISSAELFERVNKYELRIHVPGFQNLKTNCPKAVWEKLLKLYKDDGSAVYYLAAKHSIKKQSRFVTVSSPLQIRNETCFALSLLYQPSVLQQHEIEPFGDVINPFETTMRIAVLEPHEIYNVPLQVAYLCDLFIQPAYAESHYTTDCGISWKKLFADLNVSHNILCKPKADSNVENFALRIKLSKNVPTKNSHAHSVPNYVISVLAPLVVTNYLPYSLQVENLDAKQRINVEPGEKSSVYSLDLSKDLKLMIRLKMEGLSWSGVLNFTSQIEEKILALSSDNQSGRQVTINIRVQREGSCNLYVFSPYWIVNKTNLPLFLKASATNAIYETSSESIILFTYKRHQKQTVNLRVYDSNWSNDFGLECAGTTGLVVCKDLERNKKYSFLLSVKLSEMCSGLTKIVTILPCFVVKNSTTHNLRVMEHNEKTDLWIDLQSKQNLIFWPETTSMQMYVKFWNSKVHSQAFCITDVQRTLLRMDKKLGICVDISGGSTTPFLIEFQEYKDGDAPVLVKNYCADVFLKIQQQGLCQVNLVSPGYSLLYTWDDSTKPKFLMWNVYNNKGDGFVMDITKDGQGEEKINFRSVTTTEINNSSSSDDSDASEATKTSLRKKIHRDKLTIHWLCHREGLQRTLVFAQDEKIIRKISNAAFSEHCTRELFVSVAGIGASIFTNQRRETAYVSISNSPAIWEVNVGRKWKMLTLELASWIEDKYSSHCKKCQLKEYIHIDFEKMFMLKPFFAELRRNYSPGVYLQFRESQNYRYVNVKLQALQIDNNKSNASEPIFYHSPPENVRNQSAFIEINALKCCGGKDCDVFKHLKVKIRDCMVNVEDEVFLQMCTFVNRESEGGYRRDMAFVSENFGAQQNVVSSGKSTIIENLYLSQLNIQFNVFNTSKSRLEKPKFFVTRFLDYLFPLNMSPYVTPDGVQHKIPPLKLTELHKDVPTALHEVIDHIATQFLQQYYSQVLSQQVLVNPYATSNVINCDDIPEDADRVAAILQFGCRCVLGHVNMSPAAVEQCIVDIFANQNMENMQRIKRHGSYQISGDTPKSVTYSSKDFKIGVPLALEQIIIKPHKKSTCSSGELFFRGPGKALYSLITRNPDDKSNNVQVAIEAVRRAAHLGEPIRIRQRLFRYYNVKLGLKPYSIHESMGNNLLETLSNGRFSNDTYWAHTALDKTRNSVIIASLEHLIRINKSGCWGSWEIDWCLDFDEILSIPTVSSNELVLNVRQKTNNITSATGKVVISGDKDILKWLREKIEQIIVIGMDDKGWSVT